MSITTKLEYSDLQVLSNLLELKLCSLREERDKLELDSFEHGLEETEVDLSSVEDRIHNLGIIEIKLEILKEKLNER